MPTSIEAKPVTTAPFIAKPQSTQLSKEEILNLAKENGFNLMEQEEEWVKFTIELKKYTYDKFRKKRVAGGYEKLKDAYEDAFNLLLDKIDLK